MRLPFTDIHLERRAANNYTDAIVELLTNDASGSDRARGLVPSAASLASNVWARSFASARITPDNVATRALTPMILSDIGRQLCLHGAAVYEIVVNGDITLDRASDWEITGGDVWTYKLTFARPSETMTRTVEAARVLHLRHGAHATSPWAGRGILQTERQAVKIASLLELSLGDELSMATGAIAALPPGDNVQLQQDLNKLKGSLKIVESTGGNWDLGSAGSSRPVQDWMIRRLGPNPPETMEGLLEATSRLIVSAAGVSTAILGHADSAASREGFRQFLHATLQPITRIVGHQLAEALDVPDLNFDLDELRAGDLSGRSRAFASMVNAGMSLDRAAALSGLLVQE